MGAFVEGAEMRRCLRCGSKTREKRTEEFMLSVCPACGLSLEMDYKYGTTANPIEVRHSYRAERDGKWCKVPEWCLLVMDSEDEEEYEVFGLRNVVSDASMCKRKI